MTAPTLAVCVRWAHPLNCMSTHPQPKRWQSLSSIALDIRAGFLELARHGLALLGLTVLALTLAFAARPQLQNTASEWLMGWLHSRQDDGSSEQLALKDMPPEQARVTQWLSRKYRVATTPLGPLVAEAWTVGQNSQLPPTLILAVMAVESGFNPFAKGTQGAMGLMQIEPETHAEELQMFGGRLAAFDPLTNLRLGARFLQANIQASGSTEDGLRLYALASGQTNDEAYVGRVMAEHKQLERISQTQAHTASLSPRQRPL